MAYSIGSFAPTRDVTQIRRGGGRRLFAKEVNPQTGADNGPVSAWYDFGWIRQTTPSIKNGAIKEIDEGGVAAINSRSLFPEVSVKTTLMQAGMDLILMSGRTRDKAFRVYYEYGRLNGKVIEWIFGLCTFASDIEIPADPSKINETPIEFSCSPCLSTALIGGLPSVSYAGSTSTPSAFSGATETWGTDVEFSQYRVYETTLS